jgi:hypothetical protein
VEAEETEENVRSGEGHEEVTGVGDIEGEGDPSRMRGGEVDCSIVEAVAGATDFWANFVSILRRWKIGGM